jgi:hypothetical protein
LGEEAEIEGWRNNWLKKLACLERGKPVSASPASRRRGLCLRCSATRNPFFVLCSFLPSGFDTLSGAGKLYHAFNPFQNGVNNGGFHQFFFNPSGSYLRPDRKWSGDMQ